MSWDLFCTVAFRYEPQRCCPPELEELSLEIIRMREGLPLAIVAIAGFLSMKDKEAVEWKKLVDNFGTEIRSNIHLQGTLIPNDKLFKLWIAEGFVQEKRGKTLEEVAEEYLDELIQRNLVQECEGFYGLEEFCRVHGLVHELLRQKADEFRFCHIWDNKNSSSKGKSRRLSLCSNVVDQNVIQTTKNSQVRSIFHFCNGTLNRSFLVAFFGKFKLLTLLDFENALLELVPNELRNLLHLKYLSLRNRRVKSLPKSLAKLQKLQTLDLRNTLLFGLPFVIHSLQNLRHLLASCCDNRDSLDSIQGMRIKEGLGFFEELQTLMMVEVPPDGIGLIKEIEKLWKLRRLGISRLTAEVLSSLSSSIQRMNHLEYLSLYAENNDESFDLENILIPPPLLQRLVLKGLLQKLPHWIPSTQTLSMLCLGLSRLSEDPLKHLCGLPNFISLWLYRAYDRAELHLKEGSFQKLKLLVLRELHELKVMEIERGALPCLEELRIGSSPLLNVVPSGIRHLRNLRVLANYDMPAEFVLSMQPDGGSHYWKVKHVPSVIFWYRIQGRHYILYKPGEPELLDHLQGTLATNMNGFPQHCLRLSFCYNDDDADSALTSIAPWIDADLLSFSSDRFSFFSDDIED